MGGAGVYVVYMQMTRFRLGCEACGAFVECEPREIRAMGTWWVSHLRPRWALQYTVNGGRPRWTADPPTLVDA